MCAYVLHARLRVSASMYVSLHFTCDPTTPTPLPVRVTPAPPSSRHGIVASSNVQVCACVPDHTAPHTHTHPHTKSRANRSACALSARRTAACRCGRLSRRVECARVHTVCSVVCACAYSVESCVLCMGRIILTLPTRTGAILVGKALFAASVVDLSWDCARHDMLAACSTDGGGEGGGCRVCALCTCDHHVTMCV
jgi:hypothetical protein